MADFVEKVVADNPVKVRRGFCQSSPVRWCYGERVLGVMSQQESKRRVTSVRLGPLTKSLDRNARWYQMDSFPAVQVWADDVEAVLAFLEAQGRLDALFRDGKNVQTPKHRDARLAEARGAFYLSAVI